MSYFEETLDKFSENYRYLYNKLDSWKPLNDREILVELDDGRKYAYDGMSKSFRKIKTIDDVSNFTIDDWKLGFSDLLKKYIRQSGMNQYELADRIGVSRVMMSKYITCKSSPTGLVLQKIAKELNCSIDDLCPKDYIYLN